MVEVAFLATPPLQWSGGLSQNCAVSEKQEKMRRGETSPRDDLITNNGDVTTITIAAPKQSHRRLG